MKINSVTPNYIYNLQKSKKISNNDVKLSQKEFNDDNVDYSKIPFCAIYNVKPKTVNIDAEKSKLLRQINELLETQIQEGDFDDLIETAMRKAFGFIRTKLRRQAEILKELDNLLQDKMLSAQQMINRKNQLLKE